MILPFARKPPLRDPQAGVPFRPWMLAYAGSISALAPHRIGRRDEADPPRRGALLPWTLAMAGIVAAFFLGTSWSAVPGAETGNACLAAASEPAAPPALETPARR